MTKVPRVMVVCVRAQDLIHIFRTRFFVIINQLFEEYVEAVAILVIMVKTLVWL